ncbi:hypothetical protein SAMN06295905_2162 [Devosia lucknowensis]|uniref:Uncharacterized protein n=1 Tax=Devosia lucknowensis TaxID=1096929 RepID=A0A1Y6FDJ0_9HYPH|nr:hypothetical protein SAMN06295905_2162 [Devosia lucknowensis]
MISLNPHPSIGLDPRVTLNAHSPDHRGSPEGPRVGPEGGAVVGTAVHRKT